VLSVTARLMVWGESFSPSSVERIAGTTFSSKNEPGEVGAKGRYAGLPRPYGSAELLMPAVPVDSAGGTRELLYITWLKQVRNLVQRCKDAGASSVELHVDVSYDGQCNLTFEVGELAALAELEIPLTITCYTC
jgi:hypothetical protein